MVDINNVKKTYLISLIDPNHFVFSKTAIKRSSHHKWIIAVNLNGWLPNPS